MTPSGRVLGFAAALVGVAAARLLWLDADPSPSMPDPSIMDEGLWADAARGAVLFPDGFRDPGSSVLQAGWFADDLGNSYLIAPLYTWLLVLCYQVFGIGLWQTRLLSALASIGIAAIGGRFVAARAGGGFGALTVVLLGICPLLDQHGRFALLESTQVCFLLLGFALLFPLRRSPWKAALAGMALAAAALVKPNALNFGALPLAAAFGIAWFDEARARAPGVHRRRLVEAALVGVGFLLVVGPLALPVWLRHWDAFTATVAYESGSANWRLGDHLLRLGLFLSRERVPGEQLLWGLVRNAPLGCAAVWLLLVRAAAGRRWQLLPGERELWFWAAIALAIGEFGYDHAARRQVLVAPLLVCLAVQFVRQRRLPAMPGPRARAVLAWFVLLLPLLLLLKPLLANAAGRCLAGLGAPADGTAGLLGGWCALAILGLLPVTLRRVDAQPWLARVERLGLPLLLALAVFETCRLSALPPRDYSVRRAQQQLAPLVRPGEVVMGDHAATLFQPLAVRTVRRVIAGHQYSSPRPNPDVAARLHPRYVVDYADPALREFDDVTRAGYRPIARVGLLRATAGDYCFEVELWERQ